MTTFVLGPDEDKASIVASLNYLLANQGQAGVAVNQATGQIVDTISRTTVQYLYEYINVRYADNSNGTSGFSNSPTNKRYYGLRNTATTAASENPSDYVWYEVAAPGFGTYNYLYYLTNGGRQIQWYVGPSAPNNNYTQTVNGLAIDLDIVTTATTQSIVTITIYRRSATTPPIPSGGLYDFSSLQLTPPTGWSASVPAGTDPIYVSQNTFTNPAQGNIAGPSNVWTYPVIVSQNGTAKSSYNMIAYTRSPSQPITPTGGTGSWNFTTNTGTPPTGSGATWYLSPPTGTIQLWASTAVASIIGFTGIGVPTSWSTPAQLSSDGTNGTSTIVAYARVPNNPIPVSGGIITAGVTYPTPAESLATWGFSATWVSQDPDPASLNSLYQTTGVFDPLVGQTTWQTPYIASLVTSQLSGITPALGTITSGNVSGNTTINTTSTVTASSVTATTVNLGQWNISLSPTNGLLFKYNGVNTMALNTNGNLVVLGNVIPFGTVN